MNKHEKFLQFNGKTIIFLNVDGTYWIALKPICEALNIDVRRSREFIKKDPILASVVSEQALQVSKNGKKQLRKMTCIPEKFIYGWIFSIRSESKELIKYKETCYNLLYDYFHGTITNRKDLLLEKKDVNTQIHNLREELKTQDDNYKKLKELELIRTSITSKLNNMDDNLINQTEMNFN